MVANEEVHEFVHEQVLEALRRLLGELHVEPNAASLGGLQEPHFVFIFLMPQEEPSD